MDDETLVQVRLQGGTYEGVLTATRCDGIEAVHQGKVVAAAELHPNPAAPDTQRVVLELPPVVLSEGVQVVSLRSVSSGAILGRITLMAGAALAEDVRAEIALLRDELEMLKRAFRRQASA